MTTNTQSIDLTAKRALTKDSMAVDGKEEEVVSSPMKKRKTDEEEEESGSEYESEEEYDGADDAEYEAEAKIEAEAQGRVRVGTGFVRFSYVPEPEPEWDVDSYDGDYKSDPEDHKSFTTHDRYLEFRNWRAQAWKDRGFVPDPVKHICSILDLGDSAGGGLTNREYLAEAASLCVKKLNEEKGKTVEFVSVVRGNMSTGGQWKLYITFMAREYPDGPLMEYQAKAMDFAGQSRPLFPILCRPSPS